jgi:hypothetical protein
LDPQLPHDRTGSDKAPGFVGFLYVVTLEFGCRIVNGGWKLLSDYAFQPSMFRRPHDEISRPKPNGFLLCLRIIPITQHKDWQFRTKSA